MRNGEWEELRAEQGGEAGLLEVVIGGEGFGEAVATHDDEGDAVGEGPVLVEALDEERAALGEEVGAGGDDARVGVGVDAVESRGQVYTIHFWAGLGSILQSEAMRVS